MNNQEKKKLLAIVVVTITTIFACLILVTELIGIKDNSNDKKTPSNTPEPIQNTGNFNIDIIRSFNNINKDNNYLISPYSIEIGLNMLRDGSLDNTKEELDKVLGNRIINDVSVNNKIGIANGVFIKEEYKDNVKNDYYSILNNKYHSEIIYDKFTNPNKINNWVKEKTYGMIDKILDTMDKDFVMGLANAIAIDVKWQKEFECNNTRSEEFIKVDNSKINTEMMHQTYEYNAKYIKTNDAEGIIIPYTKEDNSNVELEFVGLLPNDSVDNYIKSLTNDKLNNIFNSLKEADSNFHINLSLPRFSYNYEANGSTFVNILKNLGIKDAFDPVKANFKKMVEIDNNVYVGEAIHKTHIEFNEVGTKAAAITYFGMKANGAMPVDYEEVNLVFNKPFIYMIREKNTGEMLFFGSVYEPNKWEKSTCDNM